VRAPDPRPCQGRNAMICIAEGCSGEACREVYGPSPAQSPVQPGLRAWCRSWWVTLRHGSPLTKSGRTLRRHLRDDFDAYVEVDPPRHAADQTPTTGEVR
jgi:hypothetical protein